MLEIIIIAAIADNNVIGNNNDIPWNIPEDLKRFKELTTGNPVIMGRNTFESILARIKKPLPNRKNYVLTRNLSYTPEGVHIAHTLQEALQHIRETRTTKAYIIGGKKVYEEALPLAQQLEITEVHQTPHGDTFFPDISHAHWKETTREQHEGYDFVTYKRNGTIQLQIPVHKTLFTENGLR